MRRANVRLPEWDWDRIVFGLFITAIVAVLGGLIALAIVNESYPEEIPKDHKVVGSNIIVGKGWKEDTSDRHLDELCTDYINGDFEFDNAQVTTDNKLVVHCAISP